MRQIADSGGQAGGVNRSAISCVGSTGSGGLALTVLSMFIPKLMPIAIVSAYVWVMSLVVCDWNAGKMTPQRWKDVRQLTI